MLSDTSHAITIKAPIIILMLTLLISTRERAVDAFTIGKHLAHRQASTSTTLFETPWWDSPGARVPRRIRNQAAEVREIPFAAPAATYDIAPETITTRTRNKKRFYPPTEVLVPEDIYQQDESPQYYTDEVKTYTFQQGVNEYTVSLPLDSTLRHQYKTAQRHYVYTAGTQPPADWHDDFYRMFLNHPDDTPYIIALLDEIFKATGSKDYDTLVEHAVACVQGSIAYDWNAYHSIAQSTTQYPYETLFQQTGVLQDGESDRRLNRLHDLQELVGDPFLRNDRQSIRHRCCGRER